MLGCCCIDKQTETHEFHGDGVDTLAEKTLDFESNWKVSSPDAKASPRPAARKADMKTKPSADQEWTFEEGCVLFSVPDPEGFPSGEEVKIKFTQRPFGMIFDNEVPVIIKRVEGHAWTLRVQPGWQIKAIEGSSVEDDDFEKIWSKLCALSFEENRTSM
mmetsp:Transcript_81488/g.141526  ORF Transcript_81488/g.141526 Transcript_81488/m.141526 type:complete len:160 (-) Transcript_81488:64-543(-)